jgi:hypothetical protein
VPGQLIRLSSRPARAALAGEKYDDRRIRFMGSPCCELALTDILTDTTIVV